jgi:homoserine acetyltransferase
VIEFVDTERGRFAAEIHGPAGAPPVVLIAGLGLGEVRQPTLVLAGRHDILTRPELSAELAEAMPGAELQHVEAGHMTFWEAPEAWVLAVSRWLDA